MKIAVIFFAIVVAAVLTYLASGNSYAAWAVLYGLISLFVMLERLGDRLTGETETKPVPGATS